MQDKAEAAIAPFSLGEEQLALAELARNFAKEHLAPHAVAWDEAKHFPVDVLRQAASLGMGGASSTAQLSSPRIFRGPVHAAPVVAARLCRLSR